MTINYKIYNVALLIFFNTILISSLLLTNNSIKAQQLPIYSLNIQNPYLINPALTGIEDFLNLKVGLRRQWIGIKGSPETYYVTADTVISEDKVINMLRHGLGGAIVFDKAGPSSQVDATISYAYHKHITSKRIVSFGFSVGLNYYNINTRLLEGGLPDSLVSNIEGTLSPSISIGGLYYSPDYYIGLSIKQLFSRSLYKIKGVKDYDSDDKIATIQGKRKIHSSLSLGYIYNLDVFQAAPSITVRAIPTQPLSIDYNLKLLFEERLWTGVSYRSNNSFILMAGIYFSTFLNFSYAYDLNFYDFRNFGSGAHEIILGFQIYNDKDYCPKFVW